MNIKNKTAPIISLPDGQDFIFNSYSKNVFFSNDSKKVVSGSGNYVFVTDVLTNHIIATIPFVFSNSHYEPTFRFLENDSKMVLLGLNEMRVIDILSGISSDYKPSIGGGFLGLSDDGSIASEEDYNGEHTRIRILNMDGKTLALLPSLDSMTIDGKELLFFEDSGSTMRIVDQNGNSILNLAAGGGEDNHVWFRHARFSPNGKTIWVRDSSTSHIASIYDVKTGAVRQTFSDDQIQDVGYTADSKSVVILRNNTSQMVRAE